MGKRKMLVVPPTFEIETWDKTSKKEPSAGRNKPKESS